MQAPTGWLQFGCWLFASLMEFFPKDKGPLHTHKLEACTGYTGWDSVNFDHLKICSYTGER